MLYVIIIQANVHAVFIMHVHREYYPKQYSLSSQLYNILLHEDDVSESKEGQRNLRNSFLRSS